MLSPVNRPARQQMRIRPTNVLKCFLSACGATLLTAALTGQAPGTGAVRGTVLDPAGHAASAATVRVVNQATQAFRETATDSEGMFSIPLLPPGMYAASVRMAGFA